MRMETSHCECTMRRRIYHRKLINGTLLCVETDEHAHKGYDNDDEANRYHDIMMIHGGKSVFIRFNIDCKGLSLETKLNGLIGEMRAQIGRIERGENTELLEVVHLFYPKDLSGGESSNRKDVGSTFDFQKEDPLRETGERELDMMTPSEDEGCETADAEQVSETPSEDEGCETPSDNDQPLQRCARLEALEACTVELLRRFDESKCNMDRYYHAFLELETVVNQLAENQNRITEFVQQMPGAAGGGAGAAGGGAAGGGAGAAGGGAAGGGAAGGAAGGEAREARKSAARNAKWRGIACPHGRRRYRCRHCAGGGGAAASTGSLKDS
jgi:hypothetical protein